MILRPIVSSEEEAYIMQMHKSLVLVSGRPSLDIMLEHHIYEARTLQPFIVSGVRHASVLVSDTDMTSTLRSIFWILQVFTCLYPCRVQCSYRCWCFIASDIQLKDCCCSWEDFKDAKDPLNKDAQFKKLDVRNSCEAMIRFQVKIANDRSLST